MSILYLRLKSLFSSEMDAYVFDIMGYDSVTDMARCEGYLLRTIYIPYYDIYVHYYHVTKRFIVYKTNNTFNENNDSYKNIKKIKVSTTFINNMIDIFETDEETIKLSTELKPYFTSITD